MSEDLSRAGYTVTGGRRSDDIDQHPPPPDEKEITLLAGALCAGLLKDEEAKARASGMFDNTRELVRCPKCG